MDRNSAETLTFLFTDLEGSTRLWERFPEAMKAALARHDRILRAAIQASGGHVVKSTGDGTMAVFANAAHAVAASLAAQRDLAQAPWDETGPLRVRMGLHAGQAEQRGDDFFGPTVNRTARIMAAGHGGQVLLSASAAALAKERLPKGASLLDLGEHRLKDLAMAEHVFQLVHPDLGAHFPPLAALGAAAANIPARTAAFIGRQTALRDVGDRLRDDANRLVTLVGPGGTGKTTLAVQVTREVAADFPDGVSFADLSGAEDADAMVTVIARTVGVDEASDRPPLQQVTERLHDRSMLLILDNLEQVRGASGLVAQLLGDCPKLKALATSREALHIRAEHVYPVEPMALPPSEGGRISARRIEGSEAVQLFIDRAQAIRPDFQLTDENAAAVAEICRRLDGLPLALELAAARLRLLSPEALLSLLRNRLKALSGGPRDLPERQQTLRAAIDWSYDLLTPEEQRLFQLLAVFADAGIADLEAIAAKVDAVDDLPPDILDGLAELIEKSLVRRVDGANGETRVAMLETIREFAADRLARHVDFDAQARRLHADHYAAFAQRLYPDFYGARRPEALAAMTTEAGNLRIAWDHWVGTGDLEQLNKLADSLLVLNDARSWYLDTVALITDMLAVLARDTTSPDHVSQEITLRTSLARALMATKGFTPEVEQAFAGAVELFERGADTHQQFSVLRGLLSLYQFRGQTQRAADLGAQILVLGESGNDPKIMIDGHLAVGTALMFVNDLEAGLRHLDRAISLFAAVPKQAFGIRAGSDPRIPCLTTSAFTLWLLGFPDRAAARGNDALALAAELDHPFSSAFARFHSGLLHLWRRDIDIVVDRATGLIALADQHGLQIWSAVGTCLLGAAQVGSGQTAEGLANIRSGKERYQGLRSPPVFWPILLSLDARAQHSAGRAADGLDSIRTAIDVLSPGDGATLLPEFYILQGDLLAALSGDDDPEVARSYRTALDRSAQLKARISELRAATRLCRIHQGESDREAARNRLAAVYGTFTEGFDTADLREARDLLGASPGPV